MSSFSGKVRDWEITWLSPPKGQNGEGKVRVKKTGSAEEEVTLSWIEDECGITVQTAEGVFAWDFEGALDDGNFLNFRVQEKLGHREWEGLRFIRARDQAVQSDASGKKKDFSIKSQMPGKVIRVLVKEGDSVKKGDSLLVLEAMKMENEIKAPVNGTILQVLVKEGVTLESGALLMKLGANP